MGLNCEGKAANGLSVRALASLLGLVLLFLSVTRASARTVIENTQNETDDGSGFLGELEFRPSWNPGADRVFSFNYGEVGYHLTKKISISYQQQFVNGTSDYDKAAAVTNPTMHIYDGFFRMKFDDIWVEPQSGKLSLSYEPRLYMPTDPGKAAMGMITQIHNYIKLKQMLSRDCSLTLKEDPIIHLYNVDGALQPSLDPDNPMILAANPMFENLIWLNFDYAPKKGLVSFAFKTLLDSTLYRNFDPDANNNGAWTTTLTLYPELTFNVDTHVFLGVAYESGNVLNIGNDGSIPGSPVMGSGTIHMFLRTSF